MKKYIISTVVILTALTSVSAQVAETRSQVARPTVVPVKAGVPLVMPVIAQPAIVTGDSAVDAKIKALQTEMEEKIKSIRDEYQAKIKAAIGDRKVTLAVERGSSTTPEGANRQNVEVVTLSEKPEGGIPVTAGSDGVMVPAEESKKGIWAFFSKIFGR